MAAACIGAGYARQRKSLFPLRAFEREKGRMSTDLPTFALPLSVPADRPDRFGKAFDAGADGEMVDAPVRLRAAGILRRVAQTPGALQ